MSISERIKLFRISKDLTQTELGKIAGVSNKAISSWENGSREPRMGALQKIADYYGINKSDIIEEQPADNDELSKAILQDIKKLTPEEQKIVLAQIKGILSSHK